MAALAAQVAAAEFEQSEAARPAIEIALGSGAVSADGTMAAALKIDAMEPLLRITRAFKDADGSPLLLTRAFYRADRYQVRLDLMDSTLQPDLDLQHVPVNS